MAGDERGRTNLVFGEFRLDTHALELRKGGMRIRLRLQPARLLALLAKRAGDVVTREELQLELWGAETFVDFERGLNNCVKQIREALSDDPDSPRYVETIPRRGYRFVAQVKAVEPENGSGAHKVIASGPETSSERFAGEDPPPGTAKLRWFRRIWIPVAACLLVITGVAGWTVLSRPTFLFHERDSVLVSDFENQTGDPRFDNALLTAFSVSLGQSRYANVVPRSRIEAALKRMGKPSKERITADVGREICQRDGIRGLIVEGVTRSGNQYALTAELVDPRSGVAVRSYSERVNGEDHILGALDTIAGRIRSDLGESFFQIQRADRPLPQVTTPSLTALKEYSDGQSLWHTGKFQDAVAHFNAATQLDPEFAMARAALGDAYCSHLYSYQRDRGLEEYQKALSLTSRVTDRERRIIEVDYAAGLGHVGEADRLYRLYLADYPDDSAMRWGYARLLRMHWRQTEALEQYQELLRIAPDDATTYVEMGTAYKSLDEPTDAIHAYSEAFRLDPANLKLSHVNRQYGFALVAVGEEAKAEQVFSTYASNPETRASGLDSLAFLDLWHGHYTKARTQLEEALSISEQRGDSFMIARNHFLLAVVAAGEGHKAGRLRELSETLSDFKNLGPKVEYGSLVGQEYARAGATAKAEKILKLIRPLADLQSDEQAGYLRLLEGEIALAKDNAAEAAAVLNLQDPRYGASVVSISAEALARAYDKAGRTDQAISQYERLIAHAGCDLWSWEPQQRCLEARLALSLDYLATGNKEKASSTLAPLLKDWKDADSTLQLIRKAMEAQSRVSN
ncbi:MAG TPA: winged helix-turn-helix domain-containing protein [Candidatus Bathyarchaeia archaeon]|nr:winged helix-turn-helix domain-containing protein [Candidatus Bathyarchaeia archaeon]